MSGKTSKNKILINKINKVLIDIFQIIARITTRSALAAVSGAHRLQGDTVDHLILLNKLHSYRLPALFHF